MPTIVVGLVMVFAAGSASAQGSDPLNGTWKLDVSKSTWSPGPALRSATVTFEGTDAARKVTVDSTQASGAAQHWSYSGAFGKELPVVGNPNGDTIVLKRINATTFEAQYLKGGKPTIHYTEALSADGKTLTITGTGSDAQGQPIHSVMVFSK
jgi:hypothetical protein